MIKLRYLLLAGIAALSLTPVIAGGPAFAGGDDEKRYTLYARHGWWDINLFHDGTCYATAAYDYGQHIRIGINAPNDYYIMLASPGVDRLKAVNGFTVRADFDNGQSYTGRAGVALSDGGTKIMEFQIGGHMLQSFMNANNMHMYTRTAQTPKLLIATMNLRGTYAAMLKTAECTLANGGHYEQRQPSRNPFQQASM